jgi:hypothetical protein
MFKEISTKKIVVDHKKAEELLAINTLLDQRPKSKSHISNLARKMQDGSFRIGDIAVVTLKYDHDKMILINGQHQCEAVLSNGCKQFNAILESFEVETPEDLSLLFRQFDNYPMRTIRDNARIEANALGLDWPSKIVSLVVTGLSYKEGLMGSKAVNNREQKIEKLKQYIKFGDFLHALLVLNTPSPYPPHLSRGPVVHAMILTFEKSQSESEKFWTLVRDGEGLKKSMPAHKIRDFLMTTSVNFGYGAGDRKKSSFHEMTSKCITAWNAYRKNQSTDLKYYASKDIPRAF